VTHKDFEQKWVSLIQNELLKKFPDEFIELSNTETIKMPEVTLLIGSEFFGNYELVDTSGKLYFKVDNYHKAKYLLYSNRNKPETILLPLNEEKLVSAVKEYERLLDSFLKQMNKEFRELFPESTQFPKTSNSIFNTLNLQRL
jgi:hypothetical protein